jgi:putative spermidine/putrescine transport system permease protein
MPVATLGMFSVARGYFYPQLVPANWSVRGWQLLLRPGSEVWGAVATTILLGLAVVVVALVVAVPAGRSLGQLSFRGKRFVEFLLLAPLLAPPIVVAMGVDFAFVRLRLTNGFLGVVLVHLIPAVPYAVFIMSGVFANYDAAAEGQARTLGATRFRVFRYVTLPAITPGIVVAAVLVLIVSWSQYVLTLLVGGGQVVTLPILLFATSTGGDTAVTSALALITIAPVLAFLLLGSRYVSRMPAARIGAP